MNWLVIVINKMIDKVIDKVNLKIEGVRNRVVDNLTHLASRSCAFALVLIFGAMSFLMLTMALTLVLSQLLNSLIWAFVIVSVVIFIITVLIYLRRDKLFGKSLRQLVDKLLSFKEMSK